MKKRILTVLLALALVLCFLPEVVVPAFAEGTKTETTQSKKAPKPKEITVSGPKKITVGKKVSLVAEITPKKADQAVAWSSSNSSIASVSSKGVLKGKKPGEVTVTATSKKNKKLHASIKVVILPKVKTKTIKITNAPKKLDLSKKKTATLKIEVTPKGASNSVTWKSSNPAVAKVSSKGVVKAVSPGTVTITAKAKDGSKKKATVKIKVVDTGKKTTPTPAPTATPTAKPTATPTATPTAKPTATPTPTPSPTPESKKLTGDIQRLYGLTFKEAIELPDDSMETSDDGASYYNDYFYFYDPAGLGKVTAIEIISGTKYTIEGLKIGMSRSEAETKMQSAGWSVVDEGTDSGTDYVGFDSSNKDYTVFIEGTGNTVKKIRLIEQNSWGNG